MKQGRKFTELGSCKVTDYTSIFLSSCYEEGVFKGYYLSKQYSIKDSVKPENRVNVFAKGAYRIDTLKQLEKLSCLLSDAVNKEKAEEKEKK